jgi:hypothetical protein
VQSDGFPEPYTFTGSPPDTTPSTADEASSVPYFPWECGMSAAANNNGNYVESETMSLSQGIVAARGGK